MDFVVTRTFKVLGNIIGVECHPDGHQDSLQYFKVTDVIRKIKSGDSFYTYDWLLKKYAIVKNIDNKFIKTAADHSIRNNLDNLPVIDNRYCYLLSGNSIG